mmetsp:Transcript_21023/g.43853  ORF Transcript_21023/g.43853 Transcript_21023/m.43853 type:complete len:123 (-) Transcript_21023:60-428(-)
MRLTIEISILISAGRPGGCGEKRTWSSANFRPGDGDGVLALALKEEWGVYLKPLRVDVGPVGGEAVEKAKVKLGGVLDGADEARGDSEGNARFVSAKAAKAVSGEGRGVGVLGEGTSLSSQT